MSYQLQDNISAYLSSSYVEVTSEHNARRFSLSHLICDGPTTQVQSVRPPTMSDTIKVLDSVINYVKYGKEIRLVTCLE